MNTEKVLAKLVWLAVLLAAVPLSAAEYVLRAPDGKLRGLLSAYRLTILDSVPGQAVYRVSGAQGLTLSDDDEDEDVSLEPNRRLLLPELEGNPRILRLSTTAARQALQNTSFVSFYGDRVWGSYPSQAAARIVRTPEVHRSLATGTGVVAVIDTGIDPEHPALKRVLTPGFDFIRNVPGFPSELLDLDEATRSIFNPYTTAILDSLANINPYTTAILDSGMLAQLDPRRIPAGFGHGTMVAGAVHLAAPNARIMPLKVFGGNGQATLFNVIKAIYYAQANGAKVINMSLSFTELSPALAEAVDYVTGRGAICVASAGNQGLETMVYPAGLQRAIGVASTNNRDVKSIFSNHGDNLVTVAAPGEAILTPFPGGRYAAAWGTSFAAPLVAGGIALMLQVQPVMNWERGEAALAEASPVDGNLGAGRADLWRAVMKAREF